MKIKSNEANNNKWPLYIKIIFSIQAIIGPIGTYLYYTNTNVGLDPRATFLLFLTAVLLIPSIIENRNYILRKRGER